MMLAARFPRLFAKELGKCNCFFISDLPWIGMKPELDKNTVYRTTGPAEDSLLLAEVENLIKLGAVEELDHEPIFLNPVVCARRDNEPDRIRLCLDFRYFNTFVKSKPFGMLDREHTLASIRSFNIGTRLDLAKAYHQIDISNEVKQFFAFRVGRRYFRYRRLPFGYINASHDFARALWISLKDCVPKLEGQLIYFMDDLLLLSRSRDGHMKDLTLLLRSLESTGWKLNLDKCMFFKQHFEFLGFIVSGKGLYPTDASLTRFRDLRPPVTKSEWRKILGWVNQALRFIPVGHHLLNFLTKFRTTNDKMYWDKFLECLLKSPLSTVHGGDSNEWRVWVDASLDGRGAALLYGSNIVRCASGLWDSKWAHRHSANLRPKDW